MSEQYDNSGALYKNDRKEQPKHPDYTGKAMIDGVEFWLSAWIKTGKGGSKFMSLAFKPKEQRAAAPPAKRTPGSRNTPIDMDDEIPF